jgi:hypothetical protein
MFGAGRGRPVEIHCAYTRADAGAAFRLVRGLRKLDPERLLAFLPAAARALAPPG